MVMDSQTETIKTTSVIMPMGYFTLIILFTVTLVTFSQQILSNLAKVL